MDYSGLPAVGTCERHPCPGCVAERQRERAKAQEERERPLVAAFKLAGGFALLLICGGAALYLFLTGCKPLYCSFPWLLVKYGFATVFAGAGLLAALLGVLEFRDMRRERRKAAASS